MLNISLLLPHMKSSSEAGIRLLQSYSIDEATGIAYVKSGNGARNFILLHGLGSNRYGWLANVEFLSSVATCYTLDLPGYGNSKPSDIGYSIDAYVEHLRRFLISRDLDESIVIGHSMGAQIAFHLAIHSLDAVKAVIALTPAGIETFHELQHNWVKQMYQPDLMQSLSVEQIKMNFDANFYKFGEEAQWMLNERLNFMKHTGAYKEYCKMLKQSVDGLLDKPALPILNKVLQSCLVIYGKQDKLIPNQILNPTLNVDQLVNTTRQKLLDGQVEVFDECGHFLPVDQADKFHARLSSFLSERSI